MPGRFITYQFRRRCQNTYDAIVIGSGISGGWAAKGLCELGLKHSCLSVPPG